MNIILHRRNTIDQLKKTNEKYGVEVDIRSYGTKLIIHHDPFLEGELFEKWIKFYRHGLIILNVKEEGLESRVMSILENHNIKNYFFLDQSFPYIIKYMNLGLKKIALRFSEYESIHTIINLKGKIDWVWVDSFKKFKFSQAKANKLKEANFKICLVSPELQGRNPETEIPLLKEHLRINKIKFDAVCTKRSDLWEV